MPRIISQRDFTLCKAALLAGLIGIAAWMGEVPHGSDSAGGAPSATDGLRIVPASAIFFGASCDTGKGVSL